MDTFGAGEYTYRPVEGWAKWPEHWNLHDVAGVGIDGNDNVYAFHRGDHPVVVFDRAGNVLQTWGEDVFTHAHGLHMGPDDTIDSRGDLYVHEVCYTAWDSNFPDIPRPRRIGSLQKYERIRAPG